MSVNIKIYAERNTGSNYLSKLIDENLNCDELSGTEPKYVMRVVMFINRLRKLGIVDYHNLLSYSSAIRDIYFSLSYKKNYGWKHSNVIQTKIAKHAKDYTLFVTITKNPYSWLLSLYRKPYHLETKKKQLSFEEFLSSDWQTFGRENVDQTIHNPIELWNLKNRSYMGFNMHRAINLRYEDILKNPEKIIEDIASTGNIRMKNEQFKNVVSSTKSENGKDFDYYRSYYLEEKWKNELSSEAIKYINQHLDQDVMKYFGYEIINLEDI